MTSEPARTALIVVAGEADRVVTAWRSRFNPQSVARRIPTHITILFPFVPSREVDDELLGRLRGLYAPVASFDYALASVRRFPDVAWLAPDPSTPFHALSERTRAAFPDYPPYGDPSLDPVPHCTIGVADDPESTEAIARELEAGLEGVLPIRCRAAELTLIEEERGDGPWRTRATFPFVGA